MTNKNNKTIKTKKIVLKAILNQELDNVKKSCEKLGFEEIQHNKTNIIVKTIERRDLKDNPHLFFTITFSKSEIQLEYTLTNEINERIRNIEMIELLFRISIYFDMYDIDNKQIYSEALNSFNNVTDIINTDYENLLTKYDETKNQFENANLKNKENMNIINKLNKTMIELEKRNADLSERVKTLETLSKDGLKNELLEWLTIHNGKINILEFTQTKKISQTRVEEGLDMLLKGGQIEKK